MRQELLAVVNLLEQADERQDYSAVIGFDGFVDEIIDVVNKRESFDTYTRMDTISDFGNRIVKAAGLSTNIELVTKAVKLGGNGPIMGNALVSAGIKVSYIGALGQPAVNPVFAELTDRCEDVFSIAEPGHTDALEFADGKVLIGKLQSLNDVNWANLVGKVGKDQLVGLFTRSDLIATVNWTMTPYMNEIWENLEKILPKNTATKKPLFFVDLADPEKRNNEDVLEALQIIQAFGQHYRVVLGLNRKEASEVATVLGLELSANPDQVELKEITNAIGKKLELYCLMVHPTSAVAAYCQGEFAQTQGPYTANPKLTTGAGDNLNSGFCLGLLLELPLQSALQLGAATSGYYVRNMHSPSFRQLKNFVTLWADHSGEEF